MHRRSFIRSILLDKERGHNDMTIDSFIKSVQDIMRQDAGVDGDAQRISQLVWMLFLKVYDAKEAEWELFEEDYKSIIPKDLRWRDWAED